MADLTCPAYEGLLEPGARCIVVGTDKALDRPPIGTEITVHEVLVAPEDTGWGVKKGDVWVTVVWGTIYKSVRTCNIPLAWLVLDLRHPSEVTRLARHLAERVGLDVEGYNILIGAWFAGLELQTEPMDDEARECPSVLFHDGDTLGHTGKLVRVPNITAIPDAVGRLVRAAEVVCG